MRNKLVAILFCMFPAFAEPKMVNPSSLVFEIQMGHRAKEMLRFDVRIIEGHEANVVSYLLNGEILRELVIPKGKFDGVLVEFQEIFAQRVDVRSPLIEECGQGFALKRRDAANSIISEYLCMDRASLYQQQALTRWWRSLRALLKV